MSPITQKPLIGAINGLAYAAGAALLSSSLDIRIGCEKTQFRFLAASYGRVNSSWSLPMLVGWPKAKELLYTGRVVAAEEAERIGLLNTIVPSAKLRESAIEMGQMIAKNDARMVQGLKRLLHEGAGTAVARALRVRGRGARHLAARRSSARRVQGLLGEEGKAGLAKPLRQRPADLPGIHAGEAHAVERAPARRNRRRRASAPA